MQSSEKQLKVTESDQSMTMINGPTIAFPGLNGLINPLLCLSRAQVKLLRQTRRDRDSQGTRLCKNRSNDFGMSKNWSMHQSFLSRAKPKRTMFMGFEGTHGSVSDNQTSSRLQHVALQNTGIHHLGTSPRVRITGSTHFPATGCNEEFESQTEV